MSDAGNVHLLPDSRLSNETFGSQMVDWELPGGGTVRLEAVQIFCGNCGKLFGYVPKDTCSFVSWLCGKCFEKFGAIAGTYAVPDDLFNQSVAYEMQERFGHSLNDEEILYYLERNELGTALEKLAKESPFPVPTCGRKL